jgi:ADP-ribose pyrophosphatase YjhB (NUDIX family)
MDPDWLDRAKRLQALAQSGLAFTHDRFDRERYEAIRAIAAQMIAAGAGASTEAARELEALFAAQQGYATPKVDVRAAVFRDDRVLLVRERSDGRWTLPGGWADVGDSPTAAVEREVLEESGYEVRAVKLAAVYDRDRHGHTPHPFHIWKLFFLCEIAAAEPGEPSSGAPAARPPESGHAAAHMQAAERTRASWSETDAAEFFPENALPPLSLGRVTARQIAHMFEHHRDPRRPTSFD